VFNSMPYGCEAWTITKEMESKILLAFERKCYRKLTRIGWMQKMTNSELYEQIEAAENLMQIIITRKLELFGNMSDDRKIKRVMFGRMEGVNRRGRPHKEWLGNRLGRSANARPGHGETKMARNNEDGSGHLRALVPGPWFLMMTMMMMIKG
jgi:hypothetical protein